MLHYPDGLRFQLLDDATGQPVFAGPVQLLVAADAKESFKAGRNYSKTDVLGMDFSAFTKPGRYRVFVEGIGCSYPFEIADDVWTRAFQLSMKGLLHHRSGIELGPPFTDYRRPRTMHPADGVKVFASAGAEIEGGGQDGIFKMLMEKRTDRLLPDAWGGHMDAGDWDRNSRHPAAMWLLVDLYELFPRQIGAVKLALPPAEANNAIPDVLDEVLWNLDLYRRLQTPDGGVGGGIESTAHPRPGEASWQESLLLQCLRPGPGEFVHLRRDRRQTGASPGRQRRPAVEDLRGVGPPGLGLGRQAQRRVPQDADRRETPRESRRGVPQPPQPGGVRVVAADRRADVPRRLPGHDRPGPGAGTRWSSTRRSSPTPGCRTDKAMPRCATRPASGSSRWPTPRLAFADGNAFGVTTSIPQLPPMGFVGYLSTPEMIGAILPHAWLLTHDKKYLAGAVRACQFSSGANPDNQALTTGLGPNPVRFPAAHRQLGDRPAGAGRDHGLRHQRPGRELRLRRLGPHLVPAEDGPAVPHLAGARELLGHLHRPVEQRVHDPPDDHPHRLLLGLPGGAG